MYPSSTHLWDQRLRVMRREPPCAQNTAALRLPVQLLGLCRRCRRQRLVATGRRCQQQEVE